MNRIHDKPCIECGKEIELHWGEKLEQKLIAQQTCFSCDFWLDILDRYNDTIKKGVFGEGGTYISDTNNGYTVGKENATGYFRGFDGREFTVQHECNETWLTTNLWHRGKVPEHFRNRLRPNIQFITD